ncbi:hypothetical protein CF64_25265 [Bradyrhizobium japonicum]|nr:hypothetical protein CF64_25265 [Bradyrhizobium japonicum]
MNDRLAVAMTAQDHPRRWLTLQARCEHVAARWHKAAVVERFFQQACRVVVGRAMAGQNPVFEPKLGR